MTMSISSGRTPIFASCACDRLVFALLRLFERQLPFDPCLVEAGVDHDLAVGVIDEEA